MLKRWRWSRSTNKLLLVMSWNEDDWRVLVCLVDSKSHWRLSLVDPTDLENTFFRHFDRCFTLTAFSKRLDTEEVSALQLLRGFHAVARLIDHSSAESTPFSTISKLHFQQSCVARDLHNLNFLAVPKSSSRLSRFFSPKVRSRLLSGWKIGSARSNVETSTDWMTACTFEWIGS